MKAKRVPIQSFGDKYPSPLFRKYRKGKKEFLNILNRWSQVRFLPPLSRVAQLVEHRSTLLFTLICK